MYNEDLLMKYMVDSFNPSKPIVKIQKEPGPFITISRDFGCQANTISRMLQEELAGKQQEWTILNKEIISEAAIKLGMDARSVLNITEGYDRSHMDEVLRALSERYYKSDRKVKKVVNSVITAAAKKGNVIIVGRGGAAITHDLKPSIHIKLYAPMEWRIESLTARFHTTREYMIREINKTDQLRNRLMSRALRGTMDLNNIYDLQINCSTISQKQIVAMIMALMKERFK